MLNLQLCCLLFCSRDSELSSSIPSVPWNIFIFYNHSIVFYKTATRPCLGPRCHRKLSYTFQPTFPTRPRVIAMHHFVRAIFINDYRKLPEPSPISEPNFPSRHESTNQ